MAKKQKKIIKCAVCGKEIKGVFDSYSIKLTSKIDICSSCGKSIDAVISHLVTIPSINDRKKELEHIRNSGRYNSNIVDEIRDVTWKKVLKMDKSVIIRIKSGKDRLTDAGLLESVTLRQNLEGNVYLNSMQEHTYKPLSLSWGGPEYREKTYRNGNTSYKETMTTANILLEENDSGEKIEIEVGCSEKIFDKLKALKWGSVERGTTDSETAVKNLPQAGSGTNTVANGDIMSAIKDFVQNMGNRQKTIAGVAIALICLAAIPGIVSENKAQKEAERRYASAVEFITEGKYSAAIEELNELEYKDTPALEKYCMLQKDMDESYAGKPDEFIDNLNGIPEIENEDVSRDIDKAVSSAEEAAKLQETIDSIKPKNLEELDRNGIDDIRENAASLGGYAALLDTTNLDEAERILSELESGSKAGELMSAIQNLDTDEPWEEVEKAAKPLIEEFETLPAGEKEKVVNSGKLSHAMSIAKKGKKKAKKEQKQREEEARLAEQRRAEMAAAYANTTVYITPSGNRYHSGGCRFARNGTPMTRTQAEARGLTPCQVCHP